MLMLIFFYYYYYLTRLLNKSEINVTTRSRRMISRIKNINVVTKLVKFSFQTLMSVLRNHTTAVLMLCVTIPKDRTTVHVNLDILEMNRLAQVNHNHLYFDKSVEANITFF